MLPVLLDSLLVLLLGSLLDFLPVILFSRSGGAQMQRQNVMCSCQNNFLQLAPLILSNNLLICVRLNALPLLHLDLLPLFFSDLD
jgi:hypothetical protein